MGSQLHTAIQACGPGQVTVQLQAAVQLGAWTQLIGGGLAVLNVF